MRKGLFLKYLALVLSLGWIWTLGGKVSYCQNLPPVFSPVPDCYVAVPDSEDLQLAGEVHSGEPSGGSFANGTFTSCYVAEGETIEVHVYAADPDGDHIDLSVENAPLGALFSDLGHGEGRLTWVPDFIGPRSSAQSPFVLFFVAQDENTSTQLKVKMKVANVNRNPELFAPDSAEVAVGSPLVFQVRTKDSDSEEVDLQILNPPPGMNHDPGTNIIYWTPQMADTGLWTVRFSATDQSGGECLAEIRINVIPPSTFNLILGVKESLLGTVVEVPVNLVNSSSIAGMELCIKFDPAEFTFLGVSRTGCRTQNWEYFSYKEKNLNQFHVVKIVGIADFPNQVSVVPLAPDSGAIVNLRFQLTTDPYLNGFLLPLEFCSVNFSDNTLSTHRGKFIPRPEINVTHGGVLLSSASTLIGDINLNGLSFEIGDAVTLAAYLSGKKTLNSQQLINSDVNQDGNMATLADLVFLIRHILEGLAPDGGNNPEGELVVAKIKQESLNTSISLDSDIPVGGAVMILKGEGLKVENLKLSPDAQDLDLYTSQVGDELRILVVGRDSKPLPAGDISLLVYEGEGIDSIAFSVSDQEGKLMKVNRQYENNSLPTRYALYQNYPNPFNPETVIKYAVSGNGLTHVTLKIYNVVGQLVKTLVDEQQMPGEYSHTWNGKNEKGEDVTSGMYFYKLKVSDYTETKKMVLLR